jgi:hypothetical protein
VVCSRYEKREGRPSSLIRTCQEPGERSPTKEKSGEDGVEERSTSGAPGVVESVVAVVSCGDGDGRRWWLWWWLEGIWVGGVGERGCEKWWLGGKGE